ncbi:AAA family ATPase [Serinicoccus kebangsaanensis]|uniref:AAA family ATPase n=1 Tax=Serinicoccus kebangsaanensis TaxID=2602069 RepID=UPI00124CD46C|nr:ATP-binding protein [Serinicoccus kebangsaanensis]
MPTTSPVLYLMVGLPGTGKTTEARRIETQQQALRLTKDEWIKALYGPANPEAASDVVEGRLVEIGLRALELGVSVVLDFGLWGRDERSALRQAAADLGAAAQIHYLELAPDEQRRRLDARQAREPETTWPMSDEELRGWAREFSVPTPGELDGTEAVDSPPEGFASWAAWRAHRWPAALR